MAMYALAVTPLIQALHHCQPNISQVWYADDATDDADQGLLPKFHFPLNISFTESKS